MPDVSSLRGVVEVDVTDGEKNLDRIEEKFRQAAEAAILMSPAVDGVTSSFASGNALIKDAVTGLETLNERFDAQESIANKLKLAQFDLNSAFFALGEAQGALARNTDPAKQLELEGAMYRAQVVVDRQQASVNKLAKEYTGLGDVTGETGLSITEFNNALEVGQKALAIAAKAYEETIGRAASWGDEMGDLAALTGQSVQETSSLAAMLELLGIKSSDLGRILKVMNDDGINLTRDRLFELNRAYTAIQDPVEKVAFLQDNFKRSWQDLAEVMGRDTAELNDLAEAASRSGKVIGGEAAAQAEAFNMQMTILGQMVDGVKIQVGGELIDVFHDAITTLEDWTEGAYEASRYTGEYTAWMGDLRHAITEANDKLEIFRYKLVDTSAGVDAGNRSVAAYAARWEATATAFEPVIAASEEAEKYFKKVEDEAEKARQAQDDAFVERLQVSRVGNPMDVENQRFGDSMTDLEAKAAELRGEIDKLTVSNGQYYETVEGNGATAAELELANQKLAAAYKKLSEESDPLKIAQLNVEIQKQQGVISGADRVVGGYIDNSKKITELEGDYQVVEDAINDLKKAHELATAQMVYDYFIQELAKDGWTETEKEAATKALKEWGIYEGSMIQMMDTVDQSIQEHGDNANAMIDSITDNVNGMPSTHYIDVIIRSHEAAIQRQQQQLGSEDFGGAGGGGGSGGSGGSSGGGGGGSSGGGSSLPGNDTDPGLEIGSSLSGFSQPSTIGQVIIQIFESGDARSTANAVLTELADRGLISREAVPA